MPTAVRLMRWTAGLLALLPLAWLVGSAVSGPHLTRLLADEPFARHLLNGIFVASAQAILTVVVSSAAGYALGCGRFRGRRTVTAAVAVAAVVPTQIALPGLAELTWLLDGADRFHAVIVPGAVSAFATFFYAVTFRHTPRDMLEAARLDGAGEWRIWWDVALPSARATTAAVVLLTFLGAWNALLWPAVVLVDRTRHTPAIALADLSAVATYEATPGVLAAGVLVSLVPVAAVLLVCGRDLDDLKPPPPRALPSGR